MSDVRVAGPEDATLVADLLIAFRDWIGYATPPDETVRSTVAKLIEDPNTRLPARRRRRASPSCASA